eukprot:6083660-Prymnesium_polylepis.2
MPMPHVTCHMPHATCRIPHAACRMPHDACRMPHATCHKHPLHPCAPTFPSRGDSRRAPHARHAYNCLIARWLNCTMAQSLDCLIAMAADAPLMRGARIGACAAAVDGRLL